MKKTKEDFIKEAKEIHGDKYDYSKVEYKGNKEKVCVICPEHGEFWISPVNHASKHNHCGCPICGGKFKRTTKWFVNRAKKIHGDKYNYSKVEYKKNNIKVCIICPEHGEFWQTPNDHLNGRGCKKCGKERLKKLFSKTKEQFVIDAKKIHGEIYDYSKVDYINSKTKVCIVCPEHGDFWVTPDGHLQGCGCPICGQIHTSVDALADILKKHDIVFEREKMFSWLKMQRLDFYLPEYNVAIEYQGEQHFKPVKYFGGEKRFIDRKERDNRKKELCEQNGVEILYVSFYKRSPDNIIKTEEELISKIKEYDTIKKID